MELDPLIWGPNFWFFLHTIAICYSLNPNTTTKKKYYNLIQTIPLLLPNEEMGKNFSKILDEFPVTPYLDSRESFTKWVHFIHNKINVYLGKPELTYYEAMDKYYQNYKLKDVKMREERANKHKYIYGGALILLVSLIIFLYFSK